MKNDTSPFAEKSWQEQQDKWREWRSLQLEYRQTEETEETKKEEINRQAPFPAKPAPTRHRELDRVLSRHQAAVNRAGVFLKTPPGDLHP
ncbi:MAG: hypothetical protein IKM05_07050 [Clostridia bacterium]|nr:hypothetical protein [Clostridia bacterium]MBR6753768.1 hypothetical protein [Clostridia bacterium]